MPTELRKIPGVGKKMEQRLLLLGYNSLESLKGQDPLLLYEMDRQMHGGKLDRCVLYVYRLAVYFAETPNPEPDRLLWWNWKDVD